jgi:hypothetical protein
MFAEDPEESKKALLADHYRAHFDMSKFLRVFMQPEHVELEEALEMVNDPR